MLFEEMSRLYVHPALLFAEVAAIFSDTRRTCWGYWLISSPTCSWQPVDINCQYTPTTRPVQVPLDDLVLQEIVYAYHRPNQISSETQWVKWVFRLREADKRHAIEFAEHWNDTRIAVAGAIPWVSSCMVGIIWTSRGGDAQTAFTVAGFILSSLSCKSDYKSSTPKLSCSEFIS